MIASENHILINAYHERINQKKAQILQFQKKIIKLKQKELLSRIGLTKATFYLIREQSRDKELVDCIKINPTKQKTAFNIFKSEYIRYGNFIMDLGKINVGSTIIITCYKHITESFLSVKKIPKKVQLIRIKQHNPLITEYYEELF